MDWNPSLLTRNVRQLGVIQDAQAHLVQHSLTACDRRKECGTTVEDEEQATHSFSHTPDDPPGRLSSTLNRSIHASWANQQISSTPPNRWPRRSGGRPHCASPGWLQGLARLLLPRLGSMSLSPLAAVVKTSSKLTAYHLSYLPFCERESSPNMRHENQRNCRLRLVRFVSGRKTPKQDMSFHPGHMFDVSISLSWSLSYHP